MTNFLEGACGKSPKTLPTTEERLIRELHKVRRNRAEVSVNGLITGDQVGASMLNLSKETARYAITRRESPEIQSISWPAEIGLEFAHGNYPATTGDDVKTFITKSFVLREGDALVCTVGAVMLGAYWADDMDLVIGQTRAAIEAVNSDSETIAGGIAVAVAAAWAWRLCCGCIRSHREFFDLVLAYVPPSALREQLIRAQQLPDDLTGLGTAIKLGNVRGETPLDTIPFVIWCAGKCLSHYEEAIWTALEAQGGSDVICALVGGIVVLHTGSRQIPDEWLPPDEEPPDWYEDEE